MAHSNLANTSSLSGTPGTSYNVTCNEGYSGGGVSTCMTNQLFSNVTCDPNPCTPFTVAHSDYALSNVTGGYGDMVSITCEQGYSGSGDANVVCGLDGMFTSYSCTADPCVPDSVPHSNFASADSLMGFTGDIVEVTCDVGWSGSDNTTCGSDGFFTAVLCSANNCATTSVANSDYSVADSISGTTGQTVNVTCDEGYSGSTIVTCFSNGTFSSIYCAPKSCGEPQRQIGYVFDAGTSNYLDTRIARCATAYQGSSDVISCQANQTWTVGTTCVPIISDCASKKVTAMLSEMASCDGLCTETAHGTTCQCAEGYIDSPLPNACELET